MSERAAFIQAICTNSADDTVRLVFADWLEEQGEGERAEFIRVQVKMARLGAEEKRPHTPEFDLALAELELLRRRQWELVTVGGKLRPHQGWFPSIPDSWLCKFPTFKEKIEKPLAIVSRGFVESITCTAADFLKHADSLLWHPGQTVGCTGKHCCNGQWYEGFQWSRPCHECNGTGRIPRPCPETAQPITRVVLTTWPQCDSTPYDHRIVGRERWWRQFTPRLADFDGGMARSILALEWPGIEFELPPSGEPVSTEYATGDFAPLFPG